MKTDDKNQIGIVVECYDHNASHRILVVRSRENKDHHFFYIPTTHQVDFGDTIQMNFTENKFYVYRGNSRLSYRIIPHPFPGSLLWELILEHLNNDQK